VNPVRRARNRTLLVLAVGVFDLGLEQAIVGPALPAIERHYRASPTSGTWLLTGFLLSAAIAIPLAGQLGDQLGRRRILMCSLGLFALGSLLCAVSQSMGLLITGRVVQGMGAGVAPLALALVRAELPPTRLTMAVGTLVAVGSVGSVLGLLVSGVLVDHVSVSAIFWVLFVVAVMLVFVVGAVVPESRGRTDGSLDLLGTVLFAGGLAALALGISQGNRWGWGSPRTVALYALTAVCVGAFLMRERTTSTPLFDPRTLGLRAVWSANVAIAGVGFSLLIGFTLVPLIAAYPKVTGYGLALSTTQIGLVLVPSGLATLLVGPLAGRLVPLTGARGQAVCGTLLGAATYVALALLHPSVATLTLAMVPLGVGVGMTLGAITDLAVLSAPPDQIGAVVGLNTVLRTVASALGAQVAIAVVVAAPALSAAVHSAGVRPGLTHAVALRHPVNALPAIRIPTHSGFTSAFWMAAGASVVALLAALLTPSRRADPTVRTAANQTK
jgi:EmrB/QacA subfamily drug resistance transporter